MLSLCDRSARDGAGRLGEATEAAEGWPEAGEGEASEVGGGVEGGAVEALCGLSALAGPRAVKVGVEAGDLVEPVPVGLGVEDALEREKRGTSVKEEEKKREKRRKLTPGKMAS